MEKLDALCKAVAALSKLALNDSDEKKKCVWCTDYMSGHSYLSDLPHSPECPIGTLQGLLETLES